MRPLTAKQMQKIDRDAIEVLGVPSIVLMENAGRGAAEIIIGDGALFPEKRAEKNRELSPIIVCGPGNNGGDGFVVARHLMIGRVKPMVFSLIEQEALKGDARVNAQILERMKCPMRFRRPSIAEIKNADVIVDAIFGIGLSREITGDFKSLIDDINIYGKKVISLDVPSGLDATTGKIHGVCIKADQTVTFHQLKTGLLKANGPAQTGKVIVKHIGI